MDDITYVLVGVLLLLILAIPIPIRVKSKSVTLERTLTTHEPHRADRIELARFLRKFEWTIGVLAWVVTAAILFVGFVAPHMVWFEFEARLVALILPVAIVTIYTWRATVAFKVAQRVESEYARATKGAEQ